MERRHIKFPSVTSLIYKGQHATISIPKSKFKPQPKPIHLPNPTSFNIVAVNNNNLISISTFHPPARSHSLTSINFHHDVSHKCSQLAHMMRLSYHIAIDDIDFKSKTPKCVVVKGESSMQVKQVLQSYGWWVEMMKKQKEGISESRCNLIWTDQLDPHLSQLLSTKSLQSFSHISPTQLLQSTYQGYKRYTNTNHNIINDTNLSKMLFTHPPPKLEEWVAKVKPNKVVTVSTLVMYNHLANQNLILDPHNLYQEIYNYYHQRNSNTQIPIYRTYHLTHLNWQTVLSNLKKQSSNKQWKITHQLSFATLSTKDTYNHVLLRPPKGSQTIIIQQHLQPIYLSSAPFRLHYYILAIEVSSIIKFYCCQDFYGQSSNHKRINSLQIIQHLNSNYQLNYDTIGNEIQSINGKLSQMMGGLLGSKEGVNFTLLRVEYELDVLGKPYLIEIKNGWLESIVVGSALAVVVGLFWKNEAVLRNNFRLIYEQLRQ